VRLVMPFAPGGVVDQVLAATRETVEGRLGQRMVLEHRPGAGGNVGMQAVLAAPADGYTLGVVPSNVMVINQYLYRTMPFDPLRDFVPVTMLVDIPLVLSVSARLPIRTLSEFLDFARANPGKVNYGSPGPGTPPHLAGELLARAASLDLVHVPYKGGGAAATALIANEVQFMLIAFASLQGQIQGNAVRPIAVAASARVGGLPNVPTFAEAGQPELQRALPRSWWGIVAPRGTPDAVVQRVATTFAAALAMPEAIQRLREVGLLPVGSSPADFAKVLPDEARYWEARLREMKLKLD
jgi:tripartite-type tricarboxylate transporter receptor subunit TctC